MRVLQSTFALLLFSASVFAQKPPKLSITHLTGDFYVFTTYQVYEGKPVPANAMYLVTSEGVVLFDSPWDSTQFQPLIDSIDNRHHKPVIMCIATHWHEDRTGGLAFYRQHGAKTYTSMQTDELSLAKNKKRAAFTFLNDTIFKVGQYAFQTYFGGQGHSTDNIVIWFEKEKILYGGCLIKSTAATDLGNLSDANVKEWQHTIENIQQKFGRPDYVIPGHDDWHSTAALTHTLDLIRQKNRK